MQPARRKYHAGSLPAEWAVAWGCVAAQTYLFAQRNEYNKKSFHCIEYKGNLHLKIRKLWTENRGEKNSSKIENNGE